MDPNANLEAQRRLAARIVKMTALPAGILPPVTSIAPAAAELAELVLALDGWLAGGGFPPGRWALAT